ncbi:MAG: GNAT family N-acetyltransferase [Ginsengibacter sp.]
MNIKAAIPEDKPAIIELLKKSLGESLIPKSEKLWCWKHEENPFGKSYVLVAEENKDLIGVRAFMQWQWQWKGNIYKAIRAVDTATHPEHQGKGIFKKLTLQQAEICKQQGVHFVFNTPNKQSKPGYLKMGWMEQGKLPVKLKLTQPVSGFFKSSNKKKENQTNEPAEILWKWNNKMPYLLDNHVSKKERLTTLISSNYISWRYTNNPLFLYHFLTDDENFLLISRIKNHSSYKELRIVDFILFNPNTNPKHTDNYMRKQVLDFCRNNNINFISLSGLQYKLYKSYFNWMGILPAYSFGPMVTLKNLNMKECFAELLNIKNCGYSLGDLELF